MRPLSDEPSASLPGFWLHAELCLATPDGLAAASEEGSRRAPGTARAARTSPRRPSGPSLGMSSPNTENLARILTDTIRVDVNYTK